MAVHYQVRLTVHSKELQQMVLFCAGKAVWQTANPDVVETWLSEWYGLEQTNNSSQGEFGSRHVSQHRNTRHLQVDIWHAPAWFREATVSNDYRQLNRQS